MDSSVGDHHRIHIPMSPMSPIHPVWNCGLCFREHGLLTTHCSFCGRRRVQHSKPRQTQPLWHCRACLAGNPSSFWFCRACNTDRIHTDFPPSILSRSSRRREESSTNQFDDELFEDLLSDCLGELGPGACSMSGVPETVNPVLALVAALQEHSESSPSTSSPSSSPPSPDEAKRNSWAGPQAREQVYRSIAKRWYRCCGQPLREQSPVRYHEYVSAWIATGAQEATRYAAQNYYEHPSRAVASTTGKGLRDPNLRPSAASGDGPEYSNLEPLTFAGMTSSSYLSAALNEGGNTKGAGAHHTTLPAPGQGGPVPELPAYPEVMRQIMKDIVRTTQALCQQPELKAWLQDLLPGSDELLDLFPRLLGAFLQRNRHLCYTQGMDQFLLLLTAVFFHSPSARESDPSSPAQLPDTPEEWEEQLFWTFCGILETRLPQDFYSPGPSAMNGMAIISNLVVAEFRRRCPRFIMWIAQGRPKPQLEIHVDEYSDLKGQFEESRSAAEEEWDLSELLPEGDEGSSSGIPEPSSSSSESESDEGIETDADDAAAETGGPGETSSGDRETKEEEEEEEEEEGFDDTEAYMTNEHVEEFVRAVRMTCVKWLVPLWFGSLDLPGTLLVMDEMIMRPENHCVLARTALAVLQRLRMRMLGAHWFPDFGPGPRALSEVAQMRQAMDLEDHDLITILTGASDLVTAADLAEELSPLPEKELRALQRARSREVWKQADLWNWPNKARWLELLRSCPPTFTPRSVHAYYEAFRILGHRMSPRRDGSPMSLGLDHKQFHELLCTVTPLSSVMAHRLAQIMDRDGSGIFDFREVLQALVLCSSDDLDPVWLGEQLLEISNRISGRRVGSVRPGIYEHVPNERKLAMLFRMFDDHRCGFLEAEQVRSMAETLIDANGYPPASLQAQQLRKAVLSMLQDRDPEEEKSNNAEGRAGERRRVPFHVFFRALWNQPLVLRLLRATPIPYNPDDRQSAMDSYSTPAFFHSGDLYRSTTATTDVPAPPPEKDDPSMADLTPRPWATFKTEAGVITTMVFETYRNQRFNPLKQEFTAQLLPSDRPNWSDRRGKRSQPLESLTLPRGWAWESEWTVQRAPPAKSAPDGPPRNRLVRALSEPEQHPALRSNLARYLGLQEDELFVEDEEEKNNRLALLHQILLDDDPDNRRQPGGRSLVDLGELSGVSGRLEFDDDESSHQLEMDEEGWSYAVDFVQNFGPKRHSWSLVRRQKWVRVARRIAFSPQEKQVALRNLAFLVLIDESKRRHDIEEALLRYNQQRQGGTAWATVTPSLGGGVDGEEYSETPSHQNVLVGVDSEISGARVVAVFENWRWYPIMGWSQKLLLPGKLDPVSPYSDRAGTQALPAPEAYPLPPGWHWVSPWKVDRTRGRQEQQRSSSDDPLPGVDEEGFEYALSYQDSWGKANKTTVVRRRKWIRTMVRYELEQP